MNDPERNRTSDLRFRKPEPYLRASESPSDIARASTRRLARPHKVDTTKRPPPCPVCASQNPRCAACLGDGQHTAELARLRLAHGCWDDAAVRP